MTVKPDRISQLFTIHHDALFRYLVRLSGDADIAADAAQEAFVKLLQREPMGSGERAWLFTVGTNHVLEAKRTSARRLRLLTGRGERTMGDAPPDAHASVEADERRRVVMAALDGLSDKERVAILMREEGFSHREIAGAVGTTTGSVGTLLARTLDRLTRETTLDRDAL
ncbi:MAG: sigma-70 family RNA polymerase sigma factor [bacterium]